MNVSSKQIKASCDMFDPRIKSKFQEKANHLRSIQGINRLYLKTGNLLELQDYPKIKTNQKLFGQPKPLAFRFSIDLRAPLPNPTPKNGDIFMVLGYELDLPREDIVIIKTLWKEKIIFVFADILYHSLGEYFSLVQHSIDE